MTARDDAGCGTGSARRRRERRLRSFLRHERMAIAMTLAKYKHHSAQRQKKVRVTEFFSIFSESCVEDLLMEDGVFPSVLWVMPVPQIQERIMEIDVETLAVQEQVVEEIPEVQVVERPPRPKMAAQLMALPKTVLLDGIQQQTGVQTVDAPASQVVEELGDAHTGEEVPLELHSHLSIMFFVSVKATNSGRKEKWAMQSCPSIKRRARWSLCCERRTR